jgi:hypothetical protein
MKRSSKGNSVFNEVTQLSKSSRGDVDNMGYMIYMTHRHECGNV